MTIQAPLFRALMKGDFEKARDLTGRSTDSRVIILFKRAHDGEFFNSVTDYKKRKWIRALTSGEYKQTDSQLRFYDEEKKTESFCCLGVFADLFLDGYWEDDALFVPRGEEEVMATGDLFDIDSEPITDFDKGAQEFLVHLNDSGFDFPQIARVIRRFL